VIVRVRAEPDRPCTCPYIWDGPTPYMNVEKPISQKDSVLYPPSGVLFFHPHARGLRIVLAVGGFEALAHLLKGHGVDFSTGSLGHGLSIAAGSALAAVLQGAERRSFALLRDAALLVVGSRGLGRVSAAVLGSVSSFLLHHATCPVEVVPPVERELVHCRAKDLRP